MNKKEYEELISRSKKASALDGNIQALDGLIRSANRRLKEDSKRFRLSLQSMAKYPHGRGFYCDINDRILKAMIPALKDQLSIMRQEFKDMV